VVTNEGCDGLALDGVREEESSAVGLGIRPGLDVVEERLTVIGSGVVAHANDIAREDIDVDDAAKTVGPLLSESTVEVGHIQERVASPAEGRRSGVVGAELLHVAVGILVNGPDDGSLLAEVPNSDTVDSRSGFGGVPRLKADITGDVVVHGAATSVSDGASAVRDDDFPSVGALKRGNRRIDGQGDRQEVVRDKEDLSKASDHFK